MDLLLSALILVNDLKLKAKVVGLEYLIYSIMPPYTKAFWARSVYGSKYFI